MGRSRRVGAQTSGGATDQVSPGDEQLNSVALAERIRLRFRDRRGPARQRLGELAGSPRQTGTAERRWLLQLTLRLTKTKIAVSS